MKLPDRKQGRNTLSFYYMAVVVVIGLAGIMVECFHAVTFRNVSIYIVIILCLAAVEWFSFKFWRVPMTLSFPLTYALILLFGFSDAILSYCAVLFMVCLCKRGPVRQLLFAPSLHAISLFAASYSTVSLFGLTGSGFWAEVGKAAVFTGVYFFVVNVLIDFLFLLRVERYRIRNCVGKNLIQLGIAFFSFGYLFSMLLFGSQDRGVVDLFSYLFFFAPLVAISVITVIIVCLQKERNRLKSLFTLTTELNRLLFSKQWHRKIEQLFKAFIEVEATAFWVQSGDDWLLYYQDGAVSADSELPARYQELFEKIHETKVIRNRKRENVPADPFFAPRLRAFVFAPLIVENQTVGMLVVGRSRTNSFTSAEARSMATFANQMAVMLKTHKLISEQKKRLLLEERNRIAREIHDGLAQSLAGAVMKLETSQRLFSADPGKARVLIRNSTEKLRTSLKQVRQSIYQLRPYPTQQTGLRKAIKQKIAEMEKEGGPQMAFREIGQVHPLEDEVKRVMYELIQEALHNCVKHARAESVMIRLVYDREGVELTIKDDGVGFSLVDVMMKAREEPHFGILNMNEQAEKVGASLQIDSNEGAGTTIQFVMKHEPGEEYKNDSSHVG